MISKAKESDINDMSELLEILFSQEVEFTPQPKLQKKGLQLIIEQPKLGCLLVAKIDDKIIGMTNLLFTISTALGSKVAILEDMIIHPDYRGKGIGQKLIDAAIKTAKQNNCQRITLLTDNDNTSAHHFYEKCGFTKSDMIPYRLNI